MPRVIGKSFQDPSTTREQDNRRSFERNNPVDNGPQQLVLDLQAAADEFWSTHPSQQAGYQEGSVPDKLLNPPISEGIILLLGQIAYEYINVEGRYPQPPKS